METVMDNDRHAASTSALSRRAMLGTLGAGAVGLTAAFALPTVAAAAPSGEGQQGGPLVAALDTVASLGPTPVKDFLDYVLVSGWEIQPLTSTQKWQRFDNAFQFTSTVPAEQGFAQIPLFLPVGAVIKEIELYGSTSTGSASSLRLWKSAGLAPNASQITSVAIPVNAGPFTVTLPTDVTVSATEHVRAFVNINDTVAGATKISGARIGYVPLPALVALDPIPRAYNTRDTPGLTKIASGEERTIQLPVPAGISAAIVQLTVTETGPAGFIGVFPADVATWPGNSSINWFASDSNVGNTVLAAVSPDGKIKIRAGGGSSTHVIIDVPGVIY
jgi:hypothetical protein